MNMRYYIFHTDQAIGLGMLVSLRSLLLPAAELLIPLSDILIFSRLPNLTHFSNLQLSSYWVHIASLQAKSDERLTITLAL